MNVEKEIQDLKRVVWGNMDNNDAGNKILWTGAYLMTENQAVNLPELISEQAHGIVLLFSGYTQEDSAVQNYQWHSFFVPKAQVELHAGAGMTFVLSGAGFSPMATKYIYIHDDKLTGFVSNDDAGTSSYGASYANHRYVLRHVIGV